MVHTIAAEMALGMPRIRLRLPVPDASRRARSLAWRLRMGRNDAMNAFTANEPKAEGLVALARLAGDPAKMIAAAPRHARRQLTPALMGAG
jgi:hypothetical protein